MEPIYIHLREESQETLPVGASHWFGYPDLPPDVDIPMVEEDGQAFALTLICQINLADLPVDCRSLPHAGLLLFFADIAYYRGDWDEPTISMHPSDNRVCRVLYIPGDSMVDLKSTRERFFEQDEAGPIPITLDHVATTIAEPDLQLLGTTDRLEWETWPEPCAGWQLLLMMDSMQGADYNYNFVDWGSLCFLIAPHDLKALSFADVRSIILSS